MLPVLRSEWYKFRKSMSVPVILAGPLVAFLSGLTARRFPVNAENAEFNEWVLALMMVNFKYALIFLPLVTGILAAMICRYEHQAGGWKQLLALPVTRGRIFFAKYALLVLIVLAVQLLYLAAVYAAGMIKGYTDPFPLPTVCKSAFGGWVASFPLVALQLWMSVMWKSFAAPFAVNVVFTLPAILAVNSERFGPYYPWAQPFSMMYPGNHADDIFFVPWEQLLTVVGGSFVLFFAAGYVYFQRKAV